MEITEIGRINVLDLTITNIPNKHEIDNTINLVSSQPYQYYRITYIH